MSKTVIAVFSDPKGGGDEALGRAFNALLLAYELEQEGQPYEIVFQGAGTRWPAELAKPEHPAHGLYRAVQARVAGLCGGCADVFGAETAGQRLLREAAVPGTAGVTDLARYVLSGDRFLAF